MRKVIIMFALAMGIITANAQENVTVETTNGSEQPTLRRRSIRRRRRTATYITGCHAS